LELPDNIKALFERKRKELTALLAAAVQGQATGAIPPQIPPGNRVLLNSRVRGGVQ